MSSIIEEHLIMSICSIYYSNNHPIDEYQLDCSLQGVNS
jgi:hypothetical protein